MKKALIVAIFISSLLIPLVAEAQLVPPAPPNVDTLGPVYLLPPSGSVTILSPTDSGNYSNQVQLVFVVEATGFSGQFGNVGVSIDGGVIKSVTNFVAKSVTQSYAHELHWLTTTVLATAMLPSLSEGTHNAAVYYGWQYLGTPENPSLQRYAVPAHATVNFIVADVNATNVSQAESDISAYTKPEISISSPSNRTYTTNSIQLNLTLSHIHPLATEASISYSFDGKEVSVFRANESIIDYYKNELTPFNIEIDNLSDGSHDLIAHTQVKYLYYGWSSEDASIHFTIDSTPPTISNVSITNKTYNKQAIPLIFNVNENTSWVAYNLDNQGNTTIQGNFTLTELSDGSHNIVVYANDTLGNMGKSETIFFSVNTGDSTLAIVLSGMIVVAVAIVSVGLLVYFKKHKNQQRNHGLGVESK